MTKSRNRKNHKAKVNARKMRIEHEKNRINKLKEKFIMDLIKREQENGLFDNTTPINITDNTEDVTQITGPQIIGPQI